LELSDDSDWENLSLDEKVYVEEFRICARLHQYYPVKPIVKDYGVATLHLPQRRGSIIHLNS